MKDGRQYADVVIVGGGASGLAAAIELGMKAPELSVAVLEKNDEPGRKIRATGSGRCNITNRNAEGYTDIMVFFDRIGLVTRTYENGLVYPYSESAADVADLLTERARELGARIITGAEVTSCTSSPRFTVTYDIKTASGVRKCSIESSYLILACGGKAGPMVGTTGDGYRLAGDLGHSIVTPVPVLTSVECEEWEKGSRLSALTLAGTRTRGTVRLLRKNAEGSSETGLFEETGEIQFTKYGLSGICIFNMTRHMRYDRRKGESMSDFIVTADLFPDGDIEKFLGERRKSTFPGEKTEGILRTVLKENIAAYVIGAAGMDTRNAHLADKPAEELTDEDIRAIGRAVHSLAFHPVNLRGWKEAQATSGGVSLEEIDPETSESHIVKGLYITGELADRDFMCGGYNLSNAWVTGMQAADSVAASASE